MGTIANIGDVEITWGREDFILQRGIQLSPNLNKKQESDSFYLAINDAVVVKVDFERKAIISNNEFLQISSKLGVYFNYIGMDEQKKLDKTGAEFGLELAMIKNCENIQALNDKFSSSRNSGLITTDKEMLAKFSDNLTTISYFDRLNYELNDTDLKFVDNNWKEFLHSLLWLKQFNKAYSNIDYAFIATGIGLAVLIFTGFMETEIILMLCATLICGSMYAITRNLRSWL
jgi:hypothetical protein